MVHETVYPDDICIHGASYPNETELELVHKITQGLSCDNHVTLSKPSDVTSKIIQVQTIWILYIMNGNAISMMNYRYLISDKIKKSQKSW